MKKDILVCTFLIMVIIFIVWHQQVPDSGSDTVSSPAAEQTAGDTEAPVLPDENTSVSEDDIIHEKELVLRVNGKTLDVNWEDSETVAELIACAQEATIVVHTTRYGGFEQVGSLPQSFSRNDVQTTASPGDIVLYSGNQLVLFSAQTPGAIRSLVL